MLLDGYVCHVRDSCGNRTRWKGRKVYSPDVELYIAYQVDEI
jgi:hypothetical protein